MKKINKKIVSSVMSMIVVSGAGVFALDQVFTSGMLDTPSLQAETLLQANAPLKQGKKAVKKAAKKEEAKKKAAEKKKAEQAAAESSTSYSDSSYSSSSYSYDNSYSGSSGSSSSSSSSGSSSGSSHTHTHTWVPHTAYRDVTVVVDTKEVRIEREDGSSYNDLEPIYGTIQEAYTDYYYCSGCGARK